MSAALLEELVSAGICVESRGERLHVDAPSGDLTPERRETLVRHKESLLRRLTPTTDKHGPTAPYPCGCCSWYQAPGATDWRCRECQPVSWVMAM